MEQVNPFEVDPQVLLNLIAKQHATIEILQLRLAAQAERISQLEPKADPPAD